MSIQKILDFYNHSSVKVHDILHISHKPGTHYAGPTTEGHYGLIFTIAGNGKMQFNEAKGVAGNNSVFHGGPDCWHDYSTIGKDQWDIIIIAYDILSTTSDHIPGGYYLNTYQTPEMKKLLVRLQMIKNLDESVRQLCANSLFYNILVEMFSNVISEKNMDSNALYNQISAYIEEHCIQDLDALSIARHFGIKESRLYYLFRKFSDTGPAGYQQTCRLKQAAALLKTGGITVEDVALAVGYSDGFSFSKQFKQKYGVAPSSFQKTHQPQI